MRPKALLFSGEAGELELKVFSARRPRRRRAAVSRRDLRTALLLFSTGVLAVPLLLLALHEQPEAPGPAVVSAALPETIPAQPDPSEQVLPLSQTPQGTNGALANIQFGSARVKIPSIGVNIPLVEGSSEQALFRGAWRSPFSSTPDRGGNTVIFGHRYLHLPPHPETFYALDKLSVGDTFTVDWQGKTYTYRITDTRVVPPTDVSVLAQTREPIVTLITCTPVFTTKDRLIVRAALEP